MDLAATQNQCAGDRGNTMFKKYVRSPGENADARDNFYPKHFIHKIPDHPKTTYLPSKSPPTTPRALDAQNSHNPHRPEHWLVPLHQSDSRKISIDTKCRRNQEHDPKRMEEQSKERC